MTANDSLTTVIVAFNRPKSLLRLLHSVIRAQETVGYRGRVIVSVDNGTPEVMAAAEQYKEFGLEVIAQSRRLGLFEHVLACGDLTTQYGPILVLEDDLILSPAAYPFIQETLPKVIRQNKVAALSLYAFDFNEFAGLPLHKADYPGDLFYARTGSSSGQVWWPEKWHEFRRWIVDEYDESTSFRVPAAVSGWPRSSWKRLYNFFLSSKGYYSAIPRVSFALNEGTIGTHDNGDRPVSYSSVRSIPQPIQAASMTNAVKLDEFLEYETDDMDVTLPSCGVRLSDVEFDVFGTKQLRDIVKEYVYTARKQASDKAIAEFDAGLGNPLLALTCGLRGSGLTLLQRDQFDDQGPIQRTQKELRCYVGWLNNRQLVRLAYDSVMVKIRRRFPHIATKLRASEKD